MYCKSNILSNYAIIKLKVTVSIKPSLLKAAECSAVDLKIYGHSYSFVRQVVDYTIVYWKDVAVKYSENQKTVSKTL